MNKNNERIQKKNTEFKRMDFYSQVTLRILKELDQGVLPWRKPWAAPFKGFASNYISGKEYSGINFLLLNFINPYQVPLFLTFNQVKSLGGMVKKGAKAETIYYFNSYFKDERNQRLSEEEGLKAREAGQEVRQIAFLRRYNVFNIESTTGIDWEQPWQVYKEHEPVAICELLLEKLKSPPAIVHDDSIRAYYHPTKDLINIPPLSAFDTVENYYQTLFHELAHSTGHSSRLGRFDKGQMPGMDHPLYAEEELIAEICACGLACVTGIELPSTFKDAAAYIAHWREYLKAERRAIFWAASKAQIALNYLLDRTDLSVPTPSY